MEGWQNSILSFRGTEQWVRQHKKYFGQFADKRTKLFYFISDKVLLYSLLLSYSLGEVGEEENLS